MTMLDPNQRLASGRAEELIAGHTLTRAMTDKINAEIEAWAERDPMGSSDYEATRLEERIDEILESPVIYADEMDELTWTIEGVSDIDHHLDELDPQPVGVDDEGEWITEPSWSSFVTGACLLSCEEHPEITYLIDWMAQGGSESLSAAYEFDVEFNETGENVLDTGSIEIIDDDGDVVAPRDAEQPVRDAVQADVNWESEVAMHLPVLGTTDIDYDEDNDMDTIELRIDNGPNLRFTGELVGSASTSDNNAMRNYSGDTGRWTELALYRTQGGKYICHQIGRTRWQGERDRFSGKVCENESEVIEFFGHRFLAKELYEDAGIDHARDVE